MESAQDGSTVTVRAERCSPTMPPARVAAVLGAAVESALQTLRPVALEPAPVAPVPRELAPVKPTRVMPAPAAGAPPAVPGPRVGGGAGRHDGEVRARALRLLDDGLTDAQVCAQLGISRGRLLRWDDDLTHDMHVEQFAAAGGAR